MSYKNIKCIDCGLLVDDINRSLDFYHGKLGLEIKRQDIGFAEFQTGISTFFLWEAKDVNLHLGENTVSNKGHWFMGMCEYKTVEELTSTYEELKNKGIEFVTELKDWPWGARTAYFKDPDGYLWEIYAWVGKPYTW